MRNSSDSQTTFEVCAAPSLSCRGYNAQHILLSSARAARLSCAAPLGLGALLSSRITPLISLAAQCAIRYHCRARVAPCCARRRRTRGPGGGAPIHQVQPRPGQPPRARGHSRSGALDPAQRWHLLPHLRRRHRQASPGRRRRAATVHCRTGGHAQAPLRRQFPAGLRRPGPWAVRVSTSDVLQPSPET